MVLLTRLMHRRLAPGQAALLLVKQQRHVLMQRPLITLESQDVIRSLRHDLLSNGALTPHRVKGHDCALQL